MRFLTILAALRAPFRPLWDHITAVCLLLIFSQFVRCVFITFRLPRGVPIKVGGTGAAPSGALVKQQLGSASDGFTEVKPHLAHLQVGAVL